MSTANMVIFSANRPFSSAFEQTCLCWTLRAPRTESGKFDQCFFWRVEFLTMICDMHTNKIARDWSRYRVILLLLLTKGNKRDFRKTIGPTFYRHFPFHHRCVNLLSLIEITEIAMVKLDNSLFPIGRFCCIGDQFRTSHRLRTSAHNVWNII